MRNEYFQAPRKIVGVSLEDDGDGGAAGGMVTGHQGSEDTIGAGGLGVSERKRRRTRKEQLDEDDSSDLSDDSDEDEKTAAQGIKFSKMPIRDRSKSLPPQDGLKSELDKDEGPALMVTSPSRPPEPVGQGLRRGSLGQVEAVKQRARRDTTTSSEMSSENELDPNAFARKLPGRPGGKKNVLLAERIQEEEQRDLDVDQDGGDSDLEDEDVGEASDLSDEFEVDEGIGDSPTLLGIGVGGASGDTSPIKPPPDMPPAITPQQGQNGSPKKGPSKDSLPKLPRLPPGRPISTVQPNSLLTMALKGKIGGGSGGKPFQRFADLSGKGEASPLWIKIYAPFSEKPTSAIEVPLRRVKEGNPVTFSELIGLALWRYNEDGFSPALESDEDTNTNHWTLRIVEDEEVDFDFPALVRTRPVTDFTSNNNRPPQRRARDKPWDEFGLVRATEEQVRENEELSPHIGLTTTSTMPGAFPGTPQPQHEGQQRPLPAQRMDSEATIQSTKSAPPGFNPARNPITGPSFAPSALRKETGSLLDLPQRDNPQSTPRTGAPKTVTIHFTDPNSFATSKLQIPTTSDTYIAELFDHGCKKLNLDKGVYVLKVHGTQTVAPSDRTVEALGDRLHLDLTRRRFMGTGAAGEGGMFGLGLSGSPGSSSPNAPLQLSTNTTPPGTTGGVGGRKKKAAFASQAKAAPISSTFNLNFGLTTGLGMDVGGKKYNVHRKQPLSFAPSHPRTVIITPEYLQILPAAPDSLAAPTGKVTNVPMSSIIGVKVSRKHPKMVRVLVFREKETKRYDFECNNKEEAAEIVSDVWKGVDAARGEGDF